MKPKIGDIIYFPPSSMTDEGSFRVVTHIDQQDDGSWRVAAGTIRNIGQWYTCVAYKPDPEALECILIPSGKFTQQYAKIVEAYSIVYG